MNIKYGNSLALIEHLLEGNSITRLEGIVMFGISNLTALIANLKKTHIIKSRKILYVEALTRVNKFANVVPPKNLPIREITVIEYWISK
tara:strand:+ start:503 stop:769 length:267 start_codon:yes stop_codon:yes gene_type:complete